MRRLIVGMVALVLAAVFVAPSIRAGEPPAAEEPEAQVQIPGPENPEHEKVIAGRSAKILDKIGIEDKEKYERVQKTVMQQYFNLNDWQKKYEDELKGLSKQDTDEAKARVAEIEGVRQKYHDEYLEALATELTPEQIVGIKDGMTYGKVQVTYDAYMNFVPDMSDELKKMVMDNLVEAREKAMDGVSSKEKDNVFGKYKGRINNALSAAGIDLKAGERAYFDKLKQAKEGGN
ncbi:DUF3826 domain-containing protein [Candidatus Sumerlaeota bacterium]|nr:DUF3826 domain-containing protein [Candidatus Sumerlaeota bacterium]